MIGPILTAAQKASVHERLARVRAGAPRAQTQVAAAVHAALAPAPEKLTHEAVNYRQGDATQRCGGCSMWVGDRTAETGACTLVQDPIENAGVCDRFDPAPPA